VGVAFQSLPPVYVRSLIEGATDAIKQGHVFGWSALLDLCGWVLVQPTEASLTVHQALDRGEDPGWGWARMAIARLLCAGLPGQKLLLPEREHVRVLGFIESLLQDPDVAAARDPLDQAVNSVRGVATEALIRWSLQTGRGGLPAPAGALLELVLNVDRSSGPRAIVGVFLWMACGVSPRIAIQVIGRLNERRPPCPPQAVASAATGP
jgi:hypothetical protein